MRASDKISWLCIWQCQKNKLKQLRNFRWIKSQTPKNKSLNLLNRNRQKVSFWHSLFSQIVSRKFIFYSSSFKFFYIFSSRRQYQNLRFISVNGLDWKTKIYSLKIFFSSLVVVQQIYTWGYGQEGTLGLGESSHEQIPRLIGGFEQINFIQVAAGLYHTLALTGTFQEISMCNVWIWIFQKFCFYIKDTIQFNFSFTF